MEGDFRDVQATRQRPEIAGGILRLCRLPTIGEGGVGIGGAGGTGCVFAGSEHTGNATYFTTELTNEPELAICHSSV